jgi:hypothetical protein
MYYELVKTYLVPFKTMGRTEVKEIFVKEFPQYMHVRVIHIEELGDFSKFEVYGKVDTKTET